MQPKIYPIEKVEIASKQIASAPPLPAKALTQEQVLKKLTKQIKDLYIKKNYAPNDIVAILKKSGIKVTVKEIKNIVQKPVKKTINKKAETAQNN